MCGCLLFSINLGLLQSLEGIFGKAMGSVLGEIKVPCARTTPSPGNPITACVRWGFNAEYLLPEHQTLVVKPGHGRGCGGAQAGAGVFGVPIGPHGWVVDWGTATGRLSPLLAEPLGLQVRVWYLLGHFLYENGSIRIKARDGRGLSWGH